MGGMGPNGTRYARCHFRAQKSLDFQGPTLTIALVIDIARLKIIMSRAIKTTGTLIVIGDHRKKISQSPFLIFIF